MDNEALARVIASALAICPDCNAEVGEFRTDADGIQHLDVFHDDTCPRYQAMRRNAQGEPND